MDAIILAAGASKRFGKNKLLIDFCGKNLITWNLKFLEMNEILDGNIIIVINRRNVILDKGEISHPIINTVIENYPRLAYSNIKFAFQDNDEYGPAAGIKAAAPFIKDDYIVLFGDNFLYGKINKDFEDTDAKVTYRDLQYSENNLRLATIIQDENGFNIKEKPHDVKEGKFFCGFSMFKKDTIDNVHKLKPSERKEFEITDFINLVHNKKLMNLDVSWIDVTFKEDASFTSEYIKQQIKS
jgi:dTDP-glucose pyrophosphorylase